MVRVAHMNTVSMNYILAILLKIFANEKKKSEEKKKKRREREK